MKESLPDWTTRIFRYLRRLTLDNDLAAELTQETMLKALRHQEKLRDTERAWNWLLRIATNVWNDWCRQKSRRAEVQNHSVEVADHQCSTLDGMIQQEEMEHLLLAVAKLPERQKQILSLHTWEDRSIPDIAEILGLSSGAVRSSLYEARRTLREKFAHKNELVTSRETSKATSLKHKQ